MRASSQLAPGRARHTPRSTERPSSIARRDGPPKAAVRRAGRKSSREVPPSSFVAWHVRAERQGRRVDVDVAILPVEGGEALVDLVEHGTRRSSRRPSATHEGAVVPAALCRRRTSRLTIPHLETAVAAQLHLVAELEIRKRPRPWSSKRVGQLWSRRPDVEAAPPSLTPPEARRSKPRRISMSLAEPLWRMALVQASSTASTTSLTAVWSRSAGAGSRECARGRAAGERVRVRPKSAGAAAPNDVVWVAGHAPPDELPMPVSETTAAATSGRPLAGRISEWESLLDRVAEGKDAFESGQQKDLAHPSLTDHRRRRVGSQALAGSHQHTDAGRVDEATVGDIDYNALAFEVDQGLMEPRRR